MSTKLKYLIFILLKIYLLIYTKKIIEFVVKMKF